MTSQIIPLASPAFLVSSTRQLPPPFAFTKKANTRKFLCFVSTTTTAAAGAAGAAAAERHEGRRSANYAPTCWDYDFVQSLGMPNPHMDENNLKRLEELKDVVMRLINDDRTAPLAKLEFIDAVQRLGLKYQFVSEIKLALDRIYHESEGVWLSDDLHTTSLRFRLLRQNGFKVNQDVFESFKDEKGNFIATLSNDVNGLLSMYEASFLGWEDEPIVDEAKVFATAKLKEIMAGGNNVVPPSLKRKVEHALDMPLHWRLTKIEARWFIETYEQEENVNPSLLEMAKLDFNMTQSIYQKEVAELARWWTKTGLGEIKFIRDRLVEHYFWCLGMLTHPKLGDVRNMESKVLNLITTIDDNYDVYGSLNELELLTDSIDRWDINGIDKLPFDMRKCFLALFNTTNNIGDWTLKERGFNIIPYLSKAWADLCKSYLKEAKWYHGGKKPTLQEYLNNAVVSIATPIMLLYAYFLTADNIKEDTLRYIDKVPSIIRCSAMIVRLNNDLKTSANELARGDTLKALQCYMIETGASEEEARKYINSMVNETWKTLNKEMFDIDQYPFFSEPFFSAIPNLGRAAHFFYQYGDGHGVPETLTKDAIMSLLVKPIP